MKTRSFGWSESREWLFGITFDSYLHDTDMRDAIADYRKNRENGDAHDSPNRPLPEDGKKTEWIKCPDEHTLPSPRKKGLFSKRGFKEGWDGEGHYRVRYDEGPGDRAWMEERDRNYEARMEREKARTAIIESLLEEAAKLSHGGQYLEAIKRCDYGIKEDSDNIALRKQRASFHEALFQQTKSPKHKKLLLEKAIEDYQHCTRVDEHDKAAAIKIVQLTDLLASLLASAPEDETPSTVISPGAGETLSEPSIGTRSAIKACNEAITRNSEDIAAHKARAGHFMELHRGAQTKKIKQHCLERAKADYAFCASRDGYEKECSLKVEEIEFLLAQLAGTSLSSGASGGAGTASLPPVPPPDYRDMASTPVSGGAGSAADEPRYRHMPGS